MAAGLSSISTSTTNIDMASPPCEFGERACETPEVFRFGILGHISGQRAANCYHGRSMRANEQCLGRRRIGIESIDYAV